MTDPDIRERDFDRVHADLLDALAESVDLMNRHGVRGWPTDLDRWRIRIASGDGNAVVALLGAFGGMGSFNDLLIHPANGHQVADSEMASANERLDRLQDRIYAAARELERRLEL